MRLILNVLWAVFGGGFILALQYGLAGLVCCVTIVGIPFGLQCFKLAAFAFFPFGKDFEGPTSRAAVGSVLNVVWFIFAGLWIFLTHVIAGVTLAVTIIGIPFALQHLKLGLLAVSPFGVRIREVR
jgi:uncharacterized membrane protein YccF (DUF307 family)